MTKMRKRKLKTAALILGSVLLFSCISGCEGSGRESGIPSDTVPETVVPPATESGTEPGESEAEGTVTEPSAEGSSEPEESVSQTEAVSETEEPATVPEPETEPELPYIEGYRVKVHVPSARVRSAAGLDSDVLGAASEGEVFDVTGTENGFYVITYKIDTKAYLHRSVVEYGAFEKPAVPETEAPPPAPTKAEYRPGDGTIVCLDAGHRPEGAIPGVEPIGPGAAEMKRKLSTGTQGTASDGTVYLERDINLQVTLKLKAVLEERGYSVFLTNRQLTNSERALEASASGASIYVRIHCNGSDNHAVKGLLTYAPKAGNPYLSDALVAESERLSLLIGQAAVAATGAPNLGILNGNDMTGTNWSKIPVTIVEMGFMTNVEECTLLATPSYQDQLAVGMANGIDAYFGK